MRPKRSLVSLLFLFLGNMIQPIRNEFIKGLELYRFYVNGNKDFTKGKSRGKDSSHW